MPTPRAARGGGEEAADGGEQLRLVEQEGVVAAVASRSRRSETLAAAALSACTTVRFSAVGNSQSVVKETTQKRVLRSAEGVGERAAVVGGEVEIVHRPRHVEIGVGVEAVDEGRALMAQIGFDLEVGVEAEGRLGRGPAAGGRISGAAPRRRGR